MTASPHPGPRPDLFVVGDAKCGTTSLHRLFELAPGVGTPRTRKELHFFSAPELVRAVAGPGDAAIPAAIVQDEAAFAASEERRARGFSDMFDYAGGGYYAAAVARFLERFGPERVLVLLFEELTADMAGARERLEAFLGTALPPLALPRVNVGGRVRSPIIAALLGNERLKGAVRATLPLGLRTRLAAGLRDAVATERPQLAPETRGA